MKNGDNSEAEVNCLTGNGMQRHIPLLHHPCKNIQLKTEDLNTAWRIDPGSIPRRAAALGFQDPGQARRPGRCRANRQQADNNGQDVHAHQATPQAKAVKQPQAAPLHQVALSQEAAPPQQ